MKLHDMKLHDLTPPVAENGSRLLAFHCPGCESTHMVTVGVPNGPFWVWNEDMDLPTFTPSIRVSTYHYIDGVKHDILCHSYVTDGNIQFLTDCTHSLAGQTVPIPEWE